MVEARKCVRCGCMYVAETEVCSKCQTKDGADLYRLKGFVENQEYEKITQGELAIATGITDKNLARFLGYDEFKGICVNEETIAAGQPQAQEGITELV